MSSGSAQPPPTTNPRKVRALGTAALRLLPGIGRIIEHRDELLAERVDWRARNDLLHVMLDEERTRANETMTELRRLRSLLPHERDDEQAGLGYLFVVTYGRSGSTLLTGVLNSIRGVLIRGEVDGMLMELWRFHRSGMNQRDRINEERLVSPRHPWFGIDGYPEDVALQSVRALVVDTLLRPAADTRVTGAKEIRWPDDEADFDDYIDFLREVFPGARFLVNTRDLAATARSGWWRTTPDARDRLAAADARFRGLVDRLGRDIAHHVHYDDYVDDVESLRPMYDWLGFPFDPDVVELVTNLKHSYAAAAAGESEGPAS